MKTLFSKDKLSNYNYNSKWYLIDGAGQTLGKLATEVSKLLRGKETSFYTPGIDQGNFVVIINAKHICVTGKKKTQKLYYRNSQTPGNLKIETLNQLQNRLPIRIVEKAIWGMLPKGILGRKMYKRLFVYADTTILKRKEKKTTENERLNLTSLPIEQNWIQWKSKNKI